MARLGRAIPRRRKAPYVEATAAAPSNVAGVVAAPLGGLTAHSSTRINGTATAALGPLSAHVRGNTTVEVSDLVRVTQARLVRYELVVVARVSHVAASPTFIEVDPIEWSGLSWTEELSRPQQLNASVQISALTDPVVERLRDMAGRPSELWLYRDGRLVFAGPWVGALAQGETLTLNAFGLLGYLRYRYIITTEFFSQVDQHLIVKSLVDGSQAREFGHFGIDTSAITASGVLRDLRMQAYDRNNLGQRIEEMSRKDGGFDIEVDPETRQLQLWYPSKGVDRSEGEGAVVFDAGNITDTTVTFSVGPEDIASTVFAFGTSDLDPVIGVADNAELLARFGLADYAESFEGVSVQATITEHAQALLDARDQALLIPGPNVRVSADTELSTYDVGDTVSYALHDVLGVRGAFRVRKRTVSVSSTGEEKVTLEFV